MVLVEKPVKDTTETIEHRKSPNTLSTSHNVPTRLVHEAEHKALDDTGQKIVVQLFSELSDTLSKVTKLISKLGQITNLEQFSSVLILAVRPLIQLKIPLNLCSPGDL